MPALTRPLGNESIEILDAPLVTDSRGNLTHRDWDNATAVVVGSCAIQPFPMAEKIAYEKTIEREFSRTAFRVWAPRGTVVYPTSRVRYKSQIYEVFGGPGSWNNFDGSEHHVQFVMRLKIDGSGV